MKKDNRGKLFVHMMIFVLARTALFGVRPMLAGMTAGGSAAGLSGIGIWLVSLLGMAGTVTLEDFVKYGCIIAVSEFLLLLQEKLSGKRPGMLRSGLTCALVNIGISAGGLLLERPDPEAWMEVALEGALILGTAIVGGFGIRFFLEEKPGRQKGIAQIAGAAVLMTLTVYALPKFDERLFYIELAAFLCLLLLSWKTSAPESDNYGKENYQDLARKRLTDMADSFERLSGAFRKIAVPRQSLEAPAINRVIESMSERLCSHCEKCSRCWEQNYDVTCAAAEQIFTAALEKGTVERQDIPLSFTKSCICMDDFLEETNRSLALERMKLSWSNQMAESREAVAGQLKEVARIVNEFSGDLYETLEASGIREDTIIEGMKAGHIQVKKVSVFETGSRGMEVHLYAKCKKGKCVTIREAAALLSGILGKRFVPDGAARNVVGKEYSGIRFREDTNYRALTGMARVAKQQGEVCGDTFSFLYPETGELIMMLSDGMGSGEEAEAQSRSVIELLEELLEAGFKEEPAVRLINSLLVLRAENQSFSTVDLGVVNLYTGTCGFVKAGAAAAYVKRGNQVEVVESGNLPAGIIADYEYEERCKKLYDGDFLIMVTDGVADCLQENEREQGLADLIGGIRSNNPQEIANTILTQALARNQNLPADDMTVLVAGIWRKG